LEFALNCNRMRLTSNGRLCPCLLSEDNVDLREVLRRNASPQELEHLILKAIASKPERHHLADGIVPIKQKMSQIGG
ncbi:unnamed protein product, partial [marine sediment metagenome]